MIRSWPGCRLSPTRIATIAKRSSILASKGRSSSGRIFIERAIVGF